MKPDTLPDLVAEELALYHNLKAATLRLAAAEREIALAREEYTTALNALNKRITTQG